MFLFFEIFKTLKWTSNYPTIFHHLELRVGSDEIDKFDMVGRQTVIDFNGEMWQPLLFLTWHLLRENAARFLPWYLGRDLNFQRIVSKASD